MERQGRKATKHAVQFPRPTEQERFLIGWPGYRTRPEKSGLAPVESQAEYGHMGGLMAHWLLTGRFRTRNPVYQFFMVFVGVWWSWPLLLFVTTLSSGEYEYIWLLVFMAPTLLAGVLLLVNAGNCIFGEQDWDDIAGDED
jgi:hypothetical protein